jgi:serine protease Do
MQRSVKSGTKPVADEAPGGGLIRLSAAVLLGAAVLLSGTLAHAKAAPDSFADLAARLLPSVVNISTTQVLEGHPGIEVPVLPPGSPFEEFFKEFMERSQPEQRQRRATSLGSGFFFDNDGHVITNNHVIQDAEEIAVILNDDTRLDAKVIGRDPKTDIAVLKVEPVARIQPVTFGDSDDVRVGDWVIAIGNPFGFGGTVTAGIISARGRDINAGPYDDFLQSDASINRGNSGGPMFNLDGEVIGINTAIYSPSGGSVGIGFAIPSAGAKSVIEQLIAFGEVKRGWLGVRIQTVTDQIAEAIGLDEAAGALVASVIEDGPAKSADIRPGDVILSFDGRPVDQMRRLPRIVAETEVGKTVDVTIWRNNEKVSTKVTVGALDAEEEAVATATPAPSGSPGSSRAIEGLGMTVAAIDKQTRQRYELADDAKGVVVTEVDPAGPAAEQNIRPGDLITEVLHEPVGDPKDLEKKLAAAKKADRSSILLLVEDANGPRFVGVRIGDG